MTHPSETTHTPESIERAARALGAVAAELTRRQIPIGAAMIMMDRPVLTAAVTIAGVLDRAHWLRTYHAAERLVDGKLDAAGTDDGRNIYVRVSGLRGDVRVFLAVTLTHEALGTDAVYDDKPVEVASC